MPSVCALLLCSLLVLLHSHIAQGFVLARSLTAQQIRSPVTAPMRSTSLPLASYSSIENGVPASRLHPIEQQLLPFDIPNKLTAARMVGVPLLSLAFLLKMRATSVALFVLASLTDFVDGYLARRWDQTTPFGAFLDPVADKLMVATAMILLTSSFPTVLYTIPVAVILCREIAVSALREWMAERGVRAVVKVGSLGKWKTALQMVAMTLLLCAIPGPSRDLPVNGCCLLPKSSTFLLGLALLYAATAATVISGGQYFLAALPHMKSSSSSSFVA